MNDVQQPSHTSDAYQHRWRSRLAGPPHTSSFTCDKLGFHPLTAFMMIGVDSMLFGGEIESGFLLCIFSACVGMALIIPCAIIQHRVYGDDVPTAIAKATCVGILTAIPTALPSFVTGIWGVVGAVGLAQRRAAERDNTGNPNDHHYGEN